MLKEKTTSAPNIKQTIDFTIPGGTILAIAASALLSGTSISGTPIPASAALCGALPPLFSAAALAGGVTGFIIRGNVGTHITDIVAMAAIVLFRTILARIFERNIKTEKKQYKNFRILLVGIIYILSSLVTATAFGISFALIAAIIFRGILCTVACALFTEVLRAFPKLFAKGSESALATSAPDTKAAFAVCYILIITALSPLAPFGINFARITSDFFIIAAASYGAGSAAVVYTLSVLGLTLYSPELGRTGILLAAGAVTAGNFHMYGKLPVTAAYTIITLLFCIMAGVPMGTVYIFTEIFIAALVFMLLPDRFTAFFSDRLEVKTVDVTAERLKRFAFSFGKLVEKIDRAASVLNNQTVNGKNNSIDFANVFGKICENCAIYDNCVMQNPKHLTRECSIYTDYLEKDGFITPSNIHINGCENKETIAKQINKEYNLYKYILGNGINSGQIEAITIREMDITKKLFESAVSGIIISPDIKTGDFLKSLLEKDKKISVNCGFDYDNYYHAEILTTEELGSRAVDKIIEILTRKLSRKFREKPLKERCHTEFKYRYIFSEEYRFELSYGVCDTPAPEDFSDGYSGDSHTVFEDGFGNVFFVISDGMGSGARAAVESAMTVSLITELLKSGADPLNTLRFVNLALEIKSSDETTATADILIINLYSGKVNLYKMGAAKTIAGVSGVTREFSGQSLPAGILSDNEPDSFSFRVSEGDKVALFSDGISEEMHPKLREMLLSSGISPDSAARLSVESTGSDRSDDKTLFFIAVN
ncbi:MAG: SpoIIE family protein phosphatase [Ruminococcus sp.]|jgi:stage II sporulation protein E|nr:SpoIIE family protein phosphatase [Ruminococcus sp.]